MTIPPISRRDSSRFAGGRLCDALAAALPDRHVEVRQRPVPIGHLNATLPYRQWKARPRPWGRAVVPAATAEER